MPQPSRRQIIQKVIFQVILLLVTSGVAFAAVFYITPAASSVTDLKPGDVATQDILAPKAISYYSEVLTEQVKENAVQDIPAKYTSADTRVAREQLDHLRATLAYISSVRADAYASREQKLADLAALQDIQINQETGIELLNLTEPRWQTIQQEAILVLEQVMRNTIRDNQVEAYSRSVNNLVSLALPEEHALIVAELVAGFITPNSFYSESLTEAAKNEALETVEPVVVSFASGETIVERGEVVSALDVEALQQFGLAEPEIRWQDYASLASLVLLSVCLILIYTNKKHDFTKDTRGLFLVALLFVIFLVAARMVIPIHALTPYLFPMAAFALIVSGLFSAQTALVILIPLIILATYGYTNSFELTIFYAISSIFGVLIPRLEQRITGFIWVGLSIAASGSIIILVYRLPNAETSAITLATLCAMTFVNGIIAAGLTVLLQSLLAPMLGQTTPLQLLELSRPDHPLLEFLLRNAPGTYQHSLQVANLAEQAAERIDANSLLTRVGALYHDIGKTQNSPFFVENQAPGQLDTHDNLPPDQSASIIIDHVTEGLALARKHRLPRRIQDFITEHHGTFKTRYQWAQAVNAVEGDLAQLDESKFQYGGPRPQSQETALVMLADGCEARVRAKRPQNEEELRVIIKDTVETCLDAGQLDDTPLTLKDLNTIVDSFTATLRGIYHPRVEYPSLNVPVQPVQNIGIEEIDDQESADPVAESPPREEAQKP